MSEEKNRDFIGSSPLSFPNLKTTNFKTVSLYDVSKVGTLIVKWDKIPVVHYKWKLLIYYVKSFAAHL